MYIPRSPDELSPKWLTEALLHGNVITQSAVTNSEYSPLLKQRGFYGQIFRLYLAYDQAKMENPQTIIVKLSSGNPEMRQRPNTKSSYEKEVRFYRELAPYSPFTVPACYYASIDTESGWHVILLEDLAPARTGSRSAGCSQNEARKIIHNIACFHAHWWENPKLDKLTWLTALPANFKEADLVYFREQLWPDFLRKIDSPLPAEVIKIGKLLGEYRVQIARHIFTEKPQTLLHADYHLGNMMFGENGDFFVVDWQFVSYGRGIWDAAYFLSENLKT